MYARKTILALLTASCAFSAISTWAANSVSWQVALSTTGNDVFWTSPNAIDLGFPEYDWSYEITEATANVFILGNQDLLPRLEVTSGSGTTDTLPIVVVDSVLSEPTTGSSAAIRIEVDDEGFGQASGTDITLGTVLGFPIRRVDLEISINVTGISTGDYDRDGNVAQADYQLWTESLGSIVNLAADGNRNGVVDAADYTLWRDNFAAGGGAIDGGSPIPEPACWAALTMASVILGGLRVRCPLRV